MKKIKDSRALSCLVLLAAYTIAALAGLYIYSRLNHAWWIDLLFADVAATVVILIFSLIFENASAYDPYWSVQPIVIITAAAVGKPLSGTCILLLAVTWIWGLRLTANWYHTFHGLRYQDWRYSMLRDRTGPIYPLVNAFGIHLVPTLIVYADVLPAVYIIKEGAVGGYPSTLFLCLSLLAVILQGTADHEMHRFRRAGTGGFIRTGLWRYSRHPNYLGEILMWWGVALAAIYTDEGRMWMLLGAAATTLMFLFISIPMADRRQAEKPGFDEYKAATRMLLPLRKSPQNAESYERDIK